MIEIPEELKKLFSQEKEGTRKIYEHGLAMIDDGRIQNGCRLVAAAIGDAPALQKEVLERAKQYSRERRDLTAALIGAVRDGLLVAIESECQRLAATAAAAVKDRHVLELTMGSGARYTDASQKQMALNRAALRYIGQLEVLLRDYQQNTTS